MMSEHTSERSISIGPIDGFPARIWTWAPNPQSATETIPLTPGQKMIQSVLSETPEENVWRMTQAWYKTQGKSVPTDEARSCMAAIAQEKKDRQGALEDAAKPMSDEEIKGTAEFGSKQYWVEYWAKKKGAGYVSKADEAAKKREEKAAAKAVKEAEKAAKEAVKAAKAAAKKK